MFYRINFYIKKTKYLNQLYLYTISLTSHLIKKSNKQNITYYNKMESQQKVYQNQPFTDIIETELEVSWTQKQMS